MILIRANKISGGLYHDDLISVLRQLVSLDPRKAQYHASFASVYAEAGKIDEAVIEARAAVEADPSFEAEARDFLKQLGREL